MAEKLIGRTLLFVALGIALFASLQAATADSAEPGFFTAKRMGWSPIDTRAPGTYTIRNFAIPAGYWCVIAPVRVRWGGGSGIGPSIEWGQPVPEPDAPLMFSDHIDIQTHALPPSDADDEYTTSACLVTDEPLTLPLIITTHGQDSVLSVVDGDALRFGSAG